MPDERDEYYKPWEDRSPIDTSLSGEKATGEPDFSVFATTSTTPAAAERPQVQRGRTSGQFAGQVRWAARTTRNGWNAFVAATIRVANRADIPTRVAGLELGRKSAAAGRTGLASTQYLGRQAARYAGAAYNATTPVLAAATTWLGNSAIAAARGIATATRIVARRGVQAVAGAAGAIGEQAGHATRAIASKASAAPAPSAPESELDRLIEQGLIEQGNPAPAREHARSTDLPLFSDLVEPAASVEPMVFPPGEPETSASSLSNGHSFVADFPDSIDPSLRVSAMPADARRKVGYALAIVAAIVLIAMVLARLLPGGITGPIAANPKVAPTDAEAALAGLDEGERAQIEAVVEAYILEHPEILPRAMERLQQREAGAAIGQLRDQIERPFAGAWAGNARGDVVVTEFSDFACGFCRTSVPDVERLIKSDSGVKIVYRELPILSNQSGYAARVALAAAKRGRYRDFHLTLFGLGQPTDANIAIAAEKAGVSLSEQVAAKTRPEYGAEIDRNIALMRQLGFEGTPSFVVGNRVLNGAVGYDALVRAVAEARSIR